VASSEEVKAIVRATVGEAVDAVLVETQRLVRQLERRVEELERRPPPAPASAPSAPTIVQAPAPAWVQAQAYPPAAASQPRVVQPPAPALDLRAIERSVHVEVEPALDGGRRRRRLLAVVVVFFLAVFGSLFALLAQSYAPHP
jgi:hypothetical protein